MDFAVKFESKHEALASKHEALTALHLSTSYVLKP